MTSKLRNVRSHDGGFSMIEILVAIVLIAFGLMGLAGLQSKMITAEMEAYQRSHALVLLQDMVDRLNSNRSAAKAGDYGNVTVGTGDSYTAPCNQADRVQLDLCQWSENLKGTSTTLAGANVGGLISARGCINTVSLGSSGSNSPTVVRVSVAWQAMQPTAEPNLACGSGLYSTEASRRVVSTIINLAELE